MCVVAQQNESSMRGVLLDDAPQCHLCRTRQRIRLIQNTQLILCNIAILPTVQTTRRENLSRRSEGLNLVAHNINTSVI